LPNVLQSGGDIWGVQADIARNRHAVADGRDCVRRVRTTVAVDHQPRIGLSDKAGVERFRQPKAEAFDADIPSDVQIKGVAGQA